MGSGLIGLYLKGALKDKSLYSLYELSRPGRSSLSWVHKAQEPSIKNTENKIYS